MSTDLQSPRGRVDLQGQRLSIESKVKLAFAVALACLALVGTFSFVSLLQLNRDAASVVHTYEVINRLDALLASVTDAQMGGRRYVSVGSEEYLDRYRLATATVHEILPQLRQLTADNSVERKLLASVEELTAKRLADLASVVELRQSQGAAIAQHADPSPGRQLYDELHRAVDGVKGEEEGLLREREARTRLATVATEAVIIVGGLLAMTVAAVALVAIRRDVAGRRLAERALRAAKDGLEARVAERTAQLMRVNESLTSSERRIRAFVNATSDVIYQMSPDWSEMRRLEGQDFLADTASPDRDWLHKYIHPDDQQHVMAVIHEAIRRRQTFELEHRVVRADGTVGWTFSKAIPLTAAGGEVVEWFGAASDVTARREAEMKLQAQLARLHLLRQITHAIAERQDIHSIFQIVVRALEEYLPVDLCCICSYDKAANRLTVMNIGLRSAPLAMELAMSQQAHIEVDENGLSRCVQGRLVHEPDIAALPFPFPQRLARGGLRSMVAAPLPVGDGVFGILITARHREHSFSSGECEFLQQLSEHVALATNQAQLYQTLQRAYDDLRQTQGAVLQQERLLALGKMASGIAHDINNAISPIGIYTEMLLEREPGLSRRTRDYLEIIQRAIDDVAQTVSRMREFYRARESQQRLLPVDLNRLVPQVLELTRARWSDMAQQRGITVEVRTDLAPGLPAILGIESELRDVLTNLVFNAVDAMTGGGKLTVQTRVESLQPSAPTEERVVHLEVVDTGIGMDEETRRRCLEPFFTTKGERGTGLGLAMVYGCMQRHSSDIDICSIVGQGTTVRLSFTVPAIALTDVVPPDLVQVVSSRRILVVDDDPLILNSLRDTLEADEHIVKTADGGQAGVDAFLAALGASEPFQVVITDLGMPYVDGRKVATAVKSAAPETVVLLLTGWGQRLVEDGNTPPYVDRILSKPPKLRELRLALTELARV